MIPRYHRALVLHTVTPEVAGRKSASDGPAASAQQHLSDSDYARGGVVQRQRNVQTVVGTQIEGLRDASDHRIIAEAEE